LVLYGVARYGYGEAALEYARDWLRSQPSRTLLVVLDDILDELAVPKQPLTDMLTWRGAPSEARLRFLLPVLADWLEVDLQRRSWSPKLGAELPESARPGGSPPLRSRDDP